MYKLTLLIALTLTGCKNDGKDSFGTPLEDNQFYCKENFDCAALCKEDFDDCMSNIHIGPNVGGNLRANAEAACSSAKRRCEYKKYTL